MSTPLVCVFDLTPPRRPGLDDVGGGAKENDPDDLPDPVTMPDANDDNQHQNLLVRICGIIPAAAMSVHFASGTPSIFKLAKLSTAVTIPTFTVVDNGVGDTSITWPAGTFPPAILDPEANLTGNTAGMISCENITNGIRVRTKDASGTAADLPFNAKIF